jgi:hypothetical protein
MRCKRSNLIIITKIFDKNTEIILVNKGLRLLKHCGVMHRIKVSYFTVQVISLDTIRNHRNHTGQPNPFARVAIALWWMHWVKGGLVYHLI